MNNCPNCGGDMQRGRYVPGGCTCKREPKQQDGDLIDGILEVGSKWDYFTPAAELTGANKYVLVVLALFLIVGVFLSHGILWG